MVESVMTAPISNKANKAAVVPLKPASRWDSSKKQQGKTAKEAIASRKSVASKKSKKKWKKPKRYKTTKELLVEGTFSPYMAPMILFNIPAIVMAIIALVYVFTEEVPCRKSYLWVGYNALFSIMHICAAFYMLHKVGMDKEHKPNDSAKDGAKAGDIESGTYYKLKETHAVRMKKNRGLNRIINRLSVDPKMFVYAILNVLWLIWQCKGIMLFLQSFDNKNENCGKVEFFMILDWAFSGVFFLFLLIVIMFGITCPRVLEEAIQHDPSIIKKSSNEEGSITTQATTGTLNKDLLASTEGATAVSNNNGTVATSTPYQPPRQQMIGNTNTAQQFGGAAPDSFVNSAAVGAMISASAAASPPKSPTSQQGQPANKGRFARSKKVSAASSPAIGKDKKKKKKKSKNGKPKTKSSSSKSSNHKALANSKQAATKVTSPASPQRPTPPLPPSAASPKKAISKADMMMAIKRSRSQSPTKVMKNGAGADSETDVYERWRNKKQLEMQNGGENTKPGGVLLDSRERVEPRENGQELRDGISVSISTDGDDDYDIRASSTVTSTDTVNHLYELCSPQGIQGSWDESSFDDDESLSESSYYSEDDEDPEIDRAQTMKSMEFLVPFEEQKKAAVDDGRLHL